MKVLYYSILIIILLTASIACNRSPGGFYGLYDRARYQSAIDRCLNQNANYRIHNTVKSLEILDDKNVSFGFDIGRGFLKFFGFNREVQTAILSMTTELRTTKQPSRSGFIESSNAREENERFRFNFGVVDGGDLNCDVAGNIKGGSCYDAVRATPINGLITQALTQGIGSIVNEINNSGDRWDTRIVAKSESVADTYVIPVGSIQNVREGDVFTVYNVEHQFSRGVTPCTEGSKYHGAIKTTDRPLAHVRVTRLENHSSFVQVLPEYSWYFEGSTTPSHKYIQQGALVEQANNPSTFVYRDRRGNEIPRQLHRTVEMGIIRSLILPINTAQGSGGDSNLTPGTQAGNQFSSRNALLLNLTPLLCENLREVVHKVGFTWYEENPRAELAKCGTDEATLDRLFYEEVDHNSGGQVNTLEELINNNNNIGTGTGNGVDGGVTGQQGVNTGVGNNPLTG